MTFEDQMEIINKIQETIHTPTVRYIVFHQDDSYTVTQNLEWAMRASEPIFAMTKYNVFQLGRVKREEKEKVQSYLNQVKTIEKDESEFEMEEEETNPFLELPFLEVDLEDEPDDDVPPFSDYQKDYDIEEVFELFTEPLLEQPILVYDIFTVACFELGYYTEEMDKLLQHLERMLPFYKDYLNSHQDQYPHDIHKLDFIAEQVLRSFGKLEAEIDLMKDVLNEKLLEADSVLHNQANHILSELFLSQIK